MFSKSSIRGSHSIPRRALLITLAIIFTCLPATLNGQVLVSDDFDGSGLIDQRIWRLAFGGDSATVGRTFLKSDLTTDYPNQADGAATLLLDTFTGSPDFFSGAEINTKRNFARAGGLRFEARARLVTPPPGLVGGMFLFGLSRTNDAGEAVRDEIDHEMLSNEVQPGGQNRVFTNYFNDGPFSGPGSEGSGEFVTPSYDMTEFHTYRVDWLPSRVDWYVDDVLVRTASSDIPDDPMNFRINFWAPDENFSEAYSAELQPAPDMASNETYELEVDRVEITRLNTSVGSNLLADPSFEDPSVPFLKFGEDAIPDPSITDAWIGFNMEFRDDMGISCFEFEARTGNCTLKMFGPFSGQENSSGVWQNVEASPGDVFEASAFAKTLMGDSIKETSNYTEIRLEFLDSEGNVLLDPNNPGMIPANRQTSVILEGRDPDIAEDEWVQGVVDAVAPAGTAKARMLLLFTQLEEQGGSVFFDDLSLTLLESMALECDFNGDDACNIDDLNAMLAEGPIVDGVPVDPGVNDQFDLNGDNVIDNEDRDLWLGSAASENGFGSPYLIGDANLDGSVDVSDFNNWNSNKFTSTLKWDEGDFTSNGQVDVSDFNSWNGNKFQSSNGVSAVPEPAGAAIALCALCGGWVSLRRRRV